MNRRRFQKSLYLLVLVLLFSLWYTFFQLGLYLLRAAPPSVNVSQPPSVQQTEAPETLHKPSTIAVMTMLTSTRGIYNRIWPISYHSKKEYCRRHGYDLIVGGPEDVPPGRPPAWAKLTLLQRWLHVYEYILWQDADAVFTNYNTRIESIVPHAEVDMVVSRDLHDFNTGSMILKRSPFVFRLLEHALKLRLADLEAQGLPLVWYEQSALIALMRNMTPATLTQHVYTVPQRVLNSFASDVSSWNRDGCGRKRENFAWAPGDFIAHVPSCQMGSLCVKKLEDAFAWGIAQYGVRSVVASYMPPFPKYPNIEDGGRLPPRPVVLWPVEPPTKAPPNRTGSPFVLRQGVKISISNRNSRLGYPKQKTHSSPKAKKIAPQPGVHVLEIARRYSNPNP